MLEAGLDCAGDTWAAVQDRVVSLTRVVSYDRAGLRASDSAPAPRSAREMVADLRALLGGAGIPSPYIQADEPKVVVAAIRQVVEVVRSDSVTL